MQKLNWVKIMIAVFSVPVIAKVAPLPATTSSPFMSALKMVTLVF